MIKPPTYDKQSGMYLVIDGKARWLFKDWKSADDFYKLNRARQENE